MQTRRKICIKRSTDRLCPEGPSSMQTRFFRHLLNWSGGKSFYGEKKYRIADERCRKSTILSKGRITMTRRHWKISFFGSRKRASAPWTSSTNDTGSPLFYLKNKFISTPAFFQIFNTSHTPVPRPAWRESSAK